ncbi:MAG TPA: glycosyltransferase family 2 protein [Methanothermococcus okinawensis]|uniref:Glycosyltransferase family 2 protein n=1 Tax=Methanothermococcus okinawensis TaxID=155863 RepID=A0A832ZB58_9EURY|nr:glycosyltransferase family 2 protein [Methanothermococcus okinawensis]
MERTVVIIPTYNEEKNILKVLKDLNTIPVDVLVVDDGSTDNTKKVIQEYLSRGEHRNRIYTIFKERNEGKSKALKSGTELALKLGYNYILFMDGDYQHKPKDIPKMLKKLRECGGDAVFGIRKYSSIPIHRQISNFLASVFMSILISLYVGRPYLFRDIQCGFRIIRADLLRDIYFGEGYSVEHLIAIQLAKKGAKILEEYIDVEYHPEAHSHITTRKIVDVMVDVLKYIMSDVKSFFKGDRIVKDKVKQ